MYNKIIVQFNITVVPSTLTGLFLKIYITVVPGTGGWTQLENWLYHAQSRWVLFLIKQKIDVIRVGKPKLSNDTKMVMFERNGKI